MVICRCGCEFENSRWDSHVICPNCKRVYPNIAPDMYHPISEEERRWQCEKCGELNENSCAGAPRRTCAKCGTKRPGNPGDWYEI